MSNNLTTNQNFLSPTSFRMAIDSTKYANTEYFLSSFEFPSISIGESAAPFRNQEGYVNGDTIIFDPLTVTIQIDEEMKNYMEIFNWIHDNREGMHFADITLMIMSSHNNVNKEFRFTNAFPTSLSGNTFDIQSGDIEYLKASVGFRYDYFEEIR